MAETTYQVILSTDGKHTVVATCDDLTKVKEALAWARVTYDAIVGHYGLKYEQYQKGQGNGNSVPECAVHKVPMSRQTGKYGEFWSCHQKNADGSFCDYRPNGK